MSSNIQTFIQLFVVAGWIIILVFSFTKKWQYLSVSQRYLLPIVVAGFTSLNTSLFNSVVFKLDWYSVIFYLTNFATQAMFVFGFRHKEKKMDEAEERDSFMRAFKAIANEVSEDVWIVDMESGKIEYSNNIYKELHENHDGKVLIESFGKFSEIYERNNKIALKNMWVFHQFSEPTKYGIRIFRKMAFKAGNTTKLIGIGNGK